MSHAPQALHVLQGVQHYSPRASHAPTLVIAGAAGSLGNEVLRRLAGSTQYGYVHVLAREPMRTGIAQVELTVRSGDDLALWECVQADVVVMPHAEGQIPTGLQQGFSSVSEQVVSALDFERIVWVRNAEKRAPPVKPKGLLLRAAGLPSP
jgi:hypothetical protein